MTKQGSPVIRMEKISKSFGAVKAVQEVDSHLSPGEILGLVGDNGSGKTTLMKILAGVYQPDEGSIYLEDEKVKFEHRFVARAMGIEMVFQDLGLCPGISIAENMFMGRELTKKFLGIEVLDKKKMMSESARFLKNVGIKMPSSKMRVRNLSGGQQKAVAVERAVYWDTKVVIMDEPTAALGVKEQQSVLEIMRNLKKKDMGIIFISHNLEEVFSVADRIMVLSRGRKISDICKEDVTKEEIVMMMIT